MKELIFKVADSEIYKKLEPLNSAIFVTALSAIIAVLNYYLKFVSNSYLHQYLKYFQCERTIAVNYSDINVSSVLYTVAVMVIISAFYSYLSYYSDITLKNNYPRYFIDIYMSQIKKEFKKREVESERELTNLLKNKKLSLQKIKIYFSFYMRKIKFEIQQEKRAKTIKMKGKKLSSNLSIKARQSLIVVTIFIIILQSIININIVKSWESIFAASFFLVIITYLYIKIFSIPTSRKIKKAFQNYLDEDADKKFNDFAESFNSDLSFFKKIPNIQILPSKQILKNNLINSAYTAAVLALMLIATNSFLGYLEAKNQKDFGIVYENNRSYAIIYSTKEVIYTVEADEETSSGKNILILNTSVHESFDFDGLKYENKNYSIVDIKK